jgi:amidase
MRTTCGLKAWDHVPERVAEAVRRLRGAGAVIFGTTNTPALAVFPPLSSRSGARPRGYRWDSKIVGPYLEDRTSSRWPAASRSYSVVSSHRRVREPAR